MKIKSSVGVLAILVASFGVSSVSFARGTIVLGKNLQGKEKAQGKKDAAKKAVGSRTFLVVRKGKKDAKRGNRIGAAQFLNNMVDQMPSQPVDAPQDADAPVINVHFEPSAPVVNPVVNVKPADTVVNITEGKQDAEENKVFSDMEFASEVSEEKSVLGKVWSFAKAAVQKSWIPALFSAAALLASRCESVNAAIDGAFERVKDILSFGA